MAEQTEPTVPKIRFKLSGSEWMEEKIGDVVAEKRRNIVLEDQQRYQLITVKRRNEGVVSRGHMLGREILVKNYARLHAGDFVISKRQVVHGATGIVPSSLDGAIVSNEYLTAVDSDRLSTEFFAILASLPPMQKKFFLSSYGVDIEKLFFDTEDWKKRKVIIPRVDEQRRIAEFFRLLDQLIILHQKKHNKLICLKKAMLEKMFPQEKNDLPEIRFNGFSGAWIEISLGEMGVFKRGISYSHGNVKDSGLAVLRSTNIQNYRLILKSNLQFIDLDCPEDIKLRKGDIAICMSNGSKSLVGKSAICEEEPAAPTTVGAFCSIFRSANPLAAHILKTNQYYKYLNELLAGSSINNLKNSDLSDLVFRIPSTRLEQEKIGMYFCSLEKIIDKHKTQFTKLQQIKSACLEKMFA